MLQQQSVNIRIKTTFSSPLTELSIKENRVRECGGLRLKSAAILWRRFLIHSQALRRFNSLYVSDVYEAEKPQLILKVNISPSKALKTKLQL